MERQELYSLFSRCQTRTDLIKALVETFDYKSYLEIGCRKNETFDAVKCKAKVGVDPVEGGTHKMLSDEFFKQNKSTFDIVFIDGDHHHDQVLRDALNSLMCLNSNGTIVMHDCSPPDETYEGKRNWKCGTAWRAFATLREQVDLDAIVADWDYGSGLIRRSDNNSIVYLQGKTMEDLTFDDFERHRYDWMKLSNQEQVADWVWEHKMRSIIK